MTNSIKLINRDINSKARAIRIFEKAEGRTSTILERIQICSEFYGKTTKH